MSEPISTERLREMIGMNLPCVPASPGEVATLVHELLTLRAPPPPVQQGEAVATLEILEAGRSTLYLSGVKAAAKADALPVGTHNLYLAPPSREEGLREALITEEMVERAARAMEPMAFRAAGAAADEWGDLEVEGRAQARGRARAALTAALSRAGEAPTHRHRKRGTEYVLIGYGKMQAERWEIVPELPSEPIQKADMAEVAIYQSIDDASLWVRPREEFEDGRFIALSHADGGE